MHDPQVLAFNVPNPFARRYEWGESWASRPALVTIWHCDPERDGSDDSCGWFPRDRHGSLEILAKIESAFEFCWDASYGGLFRSTGEPIYTPGGIAIELFSRAAWEHFGHSRRKRDRFMRRHLLDILEFAENTTDSIHSYIVEVGPAKRDERIRHFASIIYGCILRWSRPWWRHPRWHVHHWRLQIHPLQSLRRWLLSRCMYCGGRFRRGDCVVGQGWYSPPRRWFESFRGEREIAHGRCQARRPIPGQKYSTVESETA